ncbi:MAG: response regulator [Lentisphaerota bacterium]
MKEKILIIDDKILNMKLASDLLEHHGYSVIKAFNAEDGISALQKELPHLILLDLTLPDIDGFEVYRRIRSQEQYNNIKIVAFTATSNIDKELISFGFDDVIYKPIDTRSFVSTIKKIFAHNN